MNNGCHRQLRAEEFRRSNYVSHVPQERLRRTEAKKCIKQYESFFQQLQQEKQSRGFSSDSKGILKIRKSFKDYSVEVSGNSQSGQIIVRSGISHYAEYNFTPRSIHVYRSEQEGCLGREAAIYLHRQLPEHSVGYGIKNDLEKLKSHH
ncbi:MAG: hypothetical protein WC314_26280 [Vulcanimicrobiota bacterium]